jgi:hypothetical protein
MRVKIEIRMNIFFLHRDPSRAAKAQCDKHVVKMVLETTQMLSTAARRRGNDVGYKSAYPNHPMTIWVGDTRDNFCWALQHAIELSKEYTIRYSKFHACQKVIDNIHEYYPDISFDNITEPPQCMPDEFKDDDFVRAYRNYYVHKIGQWKHQPKWFKSLDADPYYANV